MSTVAQTGPSVKITASGDNIFKVHGTLNFDTVPLLLRETEQLIAGIDNATIDLSEVEDCNSAGLVFLLELLRQSKVRNKPVNFHALPEQMHVVARAYGVESDVNSPDFLSQGTTV